MSKENMEKLLKDLSVMARDELERANHEFPPFASDHEGYAVILEEFEEMNEEVEAARRTLACIWRAVKTDAARDAKNMLIAAKGAFLQAAAEAVQAAAMCDKFMRSQEQRSKHAKTGAKFIKPSGTIAGSKDPLAGIPDPLTNPSWLGGYRGTK